MDDETKKYFDALMIVINNNHEQLLARFDKLETKLDTLDAMQTVGFGDLDRVEKTNEIAVKQVTALRDAVQTLAKRVTNLENKP